MTAYHDVGTAVSALREGAADFLCKPFDLRELRAVLGRLLGPPAGRAEATDARPGAVRPARGPIDVTEQGATAGAASQSRAAPAQGRRAALLADRYEIEEEVGRGAMATVFRARDHRHGRSVAVKVLRKEVASSIGVDRFLGEIRIAARLHHPHILTLIDSGRQEGVPFYVMPFVDGPSLRCLLEDRGPMPVSRAAALLGDIADALGAAHALGIVHRDVKPENVLLSGRHGWVADFGVAKALWDAAGAGSTLTGTAIGTPIYMAPEQVAGGADVDQRADIYALGVLAFEMLSGRPPFTGPGTRAVLAAHLSAEPPSLRGLQPRVPAGLEETVMMCLAKDPDRRWPDTGSLSRSLSEFVAEASR